MRILFTGASSFTGCWFVQALVAAGHTVTATLRGGAGSYEGLRRRRVERVSRCAGVVEGCAFGDARFAELLETGPAFDLLCHHGADVTNYKSPDFDVAAALSGNTHNVRAVLAALRKRGPTALLLTGSVFESGEGAGSDGLPAFSPYGLSKALTAQVFHYHAAVAGVRLGKFVIANPFGPYEEPRFTHYLVRHWFEGKTPAVNTPLYVRDNIHVSLLAAAYADYAARFAAGDAPPHLAPSGYVESQGSFALRFAAQMQARLERPCPVELVRQTDFAEPRIRINTDALDPQRLGWDEARAWDELAEYYRQVFAERG